MSLSCSVHVTTNRRTNKTLHHHVPSSPTFQPNLDTESISPQSQSHHATASKIHLDISHGPQLSYSVNTLTRESADKASQLLQLNHEKYHIYFNEHGFHNHIAHHLLTLFALGASPSELQKAYDNNTSYQRPAAPIPASSIINSLADKQVFASYLGQEQHYQTFLHFFQQEIAAKGWQQVLHEYLFSGTPQAEDLLARMYAGFLHPIIHLGFGVEFAQPAIMAEALAQAAVHDNWTAAIFDEYERRAKERGGEKKSIVQILYECRRDTKLRGAVSWNDVSKIQDGVVKRAWETVGFATSYVVDENDVEKATAEMMDAAVYFTAAAQRPPHQVRFDFLFIHCVNSSIFYSAFLSPSSSLSPAIQRRLLQWKIWIDIILYVSSGSPELLRSEIENYVPKQQAGSGDDMQGVIERIRKIEDDGHACKLVRAILNAERMCRDRGKGMHVTGDMWRKVGHMAVDSVEAGEPQWIRSCGFEQAWENVPMRDAAKL